MRNLPLRQAFFSLLVCLILVDCGGGGGSGSCCKVCSIGKPCGDTCIEHSDTCHVGPGCACILAELPHDAASPGDGVWAGTAETTDGRPSVGVQLSVDGGAVNGTLAFDSNTCGRSGDVEVAGSLDHQGVLELSGTNGVSAVQSSGVFVDGELIGDMRIESGECAVIATWNAKPAPD